MDAVRARADIVFDQCRARVAGNRAGVVEWANEAFGRLTGIPLVETVNKPVTRFLERAGIELEVVDFVAEHFFAGRPCRIEFPFARPDGRCIDVLLEVDPVRGDDGEIRGFTAVARERRDEASTERSPGSASTTPSPASSVRADALRGPAGARSDLSSVVGRVARSSTPFPGEACRPLIDLVLTPDLEEIEASREEAEAITSLLLGAARAAIADSSNSWGTLTLSTGRTDPHRRFISEVYPMAACPVDRSLTSAIFLEVHDTGSPLSPEALERLAQARPDRSEREQALARVRALARGIGASFQLDSTPGCGTQALVLFRPAVG